MRPEKLAECIEKAFGGLDPPSFEEMPIRCSDDEEFLWAVESKTWQELRPLNQYLDHGGQIALLSAKAYQYYLPAFLYALIDETGDVYLSHVLGSLWYERWWVPEERATPWFYVPRGGWQELMPELEQLMPNLTCQERKSVAERRIRIAEKMAKVTEMTGCDWHDRSYLRRRWEERMPLLTDPQKNCIAEFLVHILERTTRPNEANGIRIMLDKYWRTFLVKPRNP
jgi:hypothetical protein